MPDADGVLIRLAGIGQYGDESETLADIRKHLYAEAQAAVDAFLGRARKPAEIDRLKEPQEVRRPEHYAWAVRFQTGRDDVPTIASSTGTDVRDEIIDDRSVRYAIEAVLKVVGIDQRRERPGPKPRQKSGVAEV